MNKQQRVQTIARRLGELYPAPPIPLHHTNGFTLLVAVVLSAHTTDKSVNQVTPELFALADNPDALSRVPFAQLVALLRPIGLAPRKAQSLLELSQQILERHGGQVPRTFTELEALSGVGHKTASVVMSQVFGEPAFPVDTHIHRLAQRWGLTSGRNVRQTEADLKRLFARELWNRLHLQFIYYGREHCTARGCDGTVCEICRTCYPRRKKPVVAKPA